MIKTIQTTALRNNFKEALSHVKKTKQPLIITERGVPTSVLIDIDEFEDYLMTVDKEFVASVKDAKAQMLAGDVRTFKDVFGDLK